MSLLRKDNTPGGLAVELAAAKQAWEDKRSEIIDRAVARTEAIEITQDELAREKTALNNVVTEAHS